MTAITGPVGRPDHRFSIQYPFGVVVGVAAFGQVGHFAAAVRFHQNDVRIVPSSDGDVIYQEPLAVWRPLEMLVSIAIRIEVFPVQYGADLLGLSVDNT